MQEPKTKYKTKHDKQTEYKATNFEVNEDEVSELTNKNTFYN
jgi:hypothetical protein